MKTPGVIVIGAGAAGLAAARVLSDHGCSVIILEARNRLGGRILTLCDTPSGMPMELGAEFIHGQPKATWDLVHAARLVSCEVPFEHKERRGSSLLDLPNYPGDLKKAMAGLSRLRGKDISFADYLRKYRNTKELARSRRIAVDFVQGFDAADPERLSAHSIAEEQKDIGDVESEIQFRLLKGYGALIDYLAKNLNPKLVKILLNKTVTEIRWTRSHVEIHTAKNRQIFRAACALITLPLGVLQLPPETPGSIRFSPEISEKRQPLSLLASGPIVKVLIKFRGPFSDQLGNASFIHSPSSPFPVWWTPRPLHFPVLTGWAGGPNASHLSGLTPHGLRQVAIESLVSVFRKKKSKLMPIIESIHVQNWAADPFARGAYSYVVVGGTNARRQLSQPLKQTLFFAGEATDTSGQASTVAGALASGQRAALELLSRNR